MVNPTMSLGMPRSGYQDSRQYDVENGYEGDEGSSSSSSSGGFSSLSFSEMDPPINFSHDSSNVSFQNDISLGSDWSMTPRSASLSNIDEQNGYDSGPSDYPQFFSNGSSFRPGFTSQFTAEEQANGYDTGEGSLSSDFSQHVTVSSMSSISSEEFFSQPSGSSDEAVSPVHVSSSNEDPEVLSEYFTRNNFDELCETLEVNPKNSSTVQRAHSILEEVGQHFGEMSVSKLGKGANSAAFVVDPKNTDQKHVLRLFPPSKIQTYFLANSFRLNSNHIGGEWRSILVDHPNLESNTHIIAWDSKTSSYTILSQKQVKALIENPSELEGGRELIAVGTIGNYVEGAQDLEHVIKQRGSIPGEELRPMLGDLFEGVASLNRQNVCHRDLKPENIIQLPSGEVRVIDFGSAAFVGSNGRTREWGGDRAIHPHESFGEGRYTSKKTDSYSLFRVVYHLVSGKDFFEGIPLSVMATAHENIALKEKEKSFQCMLLADPNLKGVKPELIAVMARLGATNASDRILAEEALQMPYFGRRDVTALNAA